MIILGISGKRGAGKTLLASHLVRTCGFQKVSFSEELKRLAKMTFGFTDAELTTPSLKEKKFKHYDWSPREYLIHFGEFVRYHDEDYWVKMALAKCTQKGGAYVFDDVRYPNEYNTIKKLGGHVVRINRNPEQNPYGKNLDTISETALDHMEFDYTVEASRNNSPNEFTKHTQAIISLFGE